MASNSCSNISSCSCTYFY